MISSVQWTAAQESERAYWYPSDQLHERRAQEQRQHDLYRRMADIPLFLSGSVLELGCGPMPMLLDASGFEEAVVVDPMLPSDLDLQIMRQKSLRFERSTAESWRHGIMFDHVLLCNVLQHTFAPRDVMFTATHHTGKHLYIFEWVHEPISAVHLHTITPELIDGCVPLEFTCRHRVMGSYHTPLYQQQFYAAHFERPN